jgi:hypothetical protein
VANVLPKHQVLGPIGVDLTQFLFDKCSLQSPWDCPAVAARCWRTSEVGRGARVGIGIACCLAGMCVSCGVSGRVPGEDDGGFGGIVGAVGGRLLTGIPWFAVRWYTRVDGINSGGWKAGSLVGGCDVGLGGGLGVHYCSRCYVKGLNSEYL